MDFHTTHVSIKGSTPWTHIPRVLYFFDREKVVSNVKFTNKAEYWWNNGSEFSISWKSQEKTEQVAWVCTDVSYIEHVTRIIRDGCSYIVIINIKVQYALFDALYNWANLQHQSSVGKNNFLNRV